MTHYVGIDLANNTFTATLAEHPDTLLVYGLTLANQTSGFRELLTAIQRHVDPQACLFVMENTGVYGERLCYFLHQRGLHVYVEPAHQVKRAMRSRDKTDPIDSRMIAEYGFRFRDKLHPWEPPSPIVEQVRALLCQRELIQKEKTAHKNVLKALGKKEIALVSIHQACIDFLSAKKAEIDKQIKTELRKDAIVSQHTTNLLSIPGVGLVFCAHFFVVTDGYREVNYRNLSGYLGICPRRHESGETVKKRPKSDKRGPDRMRRQLYLSVMTNIKCQEPYKNYFARKTAEGKPGKLIINNLKNRLLRTACAIILTGRPYNKNFRSIRKKP
jgi:transposase